MPIPKAHRPRWRYLAVTIETPPGATIDRRSFQRATWNAVRSLLGDPGSADVDLSVIRFSSVAGVAEAVVRTRRDEVSRGRAALSCLTTIDGHPVGLLVRGVSGTVRACVERFLSSDGPVEAERTTVRFEGRTREAAVRGDRVDLGDGDTFTGTTTLNSERE
jgi:ribonuclease P/MRP protein subunit POP5